MKIVSVRSTIAAIPRRRALRTSYGESPDTVTVVAQVYTDEGITGVGQTVAPAPWYGETAEAIKAAVDRYLAPAILGEDPLNIEGLFARMDQALRGARYAITAVEYALWDIKGKALGVPVYQLLGGKCQAGAPLHAFVERGSPEETAARVEELAAQGWTWFKTKIGFGPEEDVAWYRALQSRVGGGVRFQLDGNTGYALGEAVQALSQMERVGGVALFEQPVRYLDEMAALAARLETPLQADELVTSPRSVYEIARERAAHVLHLKLHKYGGLLQAKRMAAVAEAAGLELSVAPYFDVLAAAVAHFAASTPNVRWPAGFSDMQDTLLAEPFVPAGQVAVPPERPGLGVDLDEDKLAAYGARWR
ncbi:MAG: mandelate racemase/muconate lactonizing enzyme family protein [Anaerolineae bacterium]